MQNFFVSILLFSFFIFGARSQAQQKGQTPTSLKETVGTFIHSLEQLPNTGVSVVVVKGGKVILIEGYGFRDRAAQTPVTPHTLFEIGSITKSFTATSLALLNERGAVDFNKPVHEYLPHFHMLDPEANAVANITDLMSHRSGLPRHEFFWFFTPFLGEVEANHAGYLEANAKPELGFRKSFQYSNIMVNVAGTVIEQVTHTSWEAFVHQNLLLPLNMVHTNFSALALEHAPDHATPYYQEQAAPYVDLRHIKAAGAINSSAVDMAQWLLFQLSKGKDTHGKEVVSEQALNLLLKPQIMVPTGDNRLAYGMGWFIENSPNGKIIWHGGNTFGYTANISFIPEKNIGVVVLVNQHGSDLAAKLTDKIYHYLLTSTDGLSLYGTPRQTLRQTQLRQLMHQDIFIRPHRQASLHSLQPLTEEQAASFSGTYSHRAYGDIFVKAKDGKLFMKYYKFVAEIKLDDKNQTVFPFKEAGVDDQLQVKFIVKDRKALSLQVSLEEASGPTNFIKRPSEQ